MKFQSKNGINADKFEQVKQDKLDNQLKDFMAKAKEAKKVEAVPEEEPAKIEEEPPIAEEEKK